MSEATDVILVQPPFQGPYYFWKSECLALGYLAASLERHGYSVRLIDGFLMDTPCHQIVQDILARPPRLLLGFSMLSYELFRSGEEIIRDLRKCGFDRHITVGSWFPTFWHETMIAEGLSVDSIVRGEGEFAIAALAGYIRDGLWPAMPAAVGVEEHNDILILHQDGPVNLDQLPPPKRTLLDEAYARYHLATVFSGRGCAHGKCAFCSVSSFYEGAGGFRQHGAPRVVDEVLDLAARGVNFVFFVDEDFLGKAPEGPKRAVDIFEGAAKAGASMRFAFNCRVTSINQSLFHRLKELGLAAAYVGMESNIDRCLRLFRKGYLSGQVVAAADILQQMEVRLVPGWIMFDRDSTFEEIEAGMQFLDRLPSYHVDYLKSLYVMKGTPLSLAYDEDLYRCYYHSLYYFNSPEVALLVRIITNDFMPEIKPCFEQIYPIWHTLLTGRASAADNSLYESINRGVKEVEFGFTREVIKRIKSGSLRGLNHVLAEYVSRAQAVSNDVNLLAGRLLSSDGHIMERP